MGEIFVAFSKNLNFMYIIWACFIIDVVTKQDALILPYVATLNVIQVVKDCWNVASLTYMPIGSFFNLE